MRYVKNSTRWIYPCLVFGFLSGCGASKRIESADVPSSAAQAASPTKSVHPGYDHYRVRAQDCLWTIAGKTNIYGDPFQWPLLFKANRDQIKDPDLIYPRQVLAISPDPSAEERSHAKRTAMATPRYVPHSKPRETLPVDYF